MALLFLDVDGTLLPFGPPRASVVGANPLLSRIDPRYGPRLAALPCELVWATTWMEHANDAIAPILGFPRLPVLDAPEPSVEDDYVGLHWKTRGVLNWAAGRAFAWLDDEITDADREWIGAHHPAPALLLRVDCRRGLTDEDFDTLATWLNQDDVRRRSE